MDKGKIRIAVIAGIVLVGAVVVKAVIKHVAKKRKD